MNDPRPLPTHALIHATEDASPAPPDPSAPLGVTTSGTQNVSGILPRRQSQSSPATPNEKIRAALVMLNEVKHPACRQGVCTECDREPPRVIECPGALLLSFRAKPRNLACEQGVCTEYDRAPPPVIECPGALLLSFRAKPRNLAVAGTHHNARHTARYAVPPDIGAVYARHMHAVIRATEDASPAPPDPSAPLGVTTGRTQNIPGIPPRHLP